MSADGCSGPALRPTRKGGLGSHPAVAAAARRRRRRSCLNDRNIVRAGRCGVVDNRRWPCPDSDCGPCCRDMMRAWGGRLSMASLAGWARAAAPASPKSPGIARRFLQRFFRAIPTAPSTAGSAAISTATRQFPHLLGIHLIESGGGGAASRGGAGRRGPGPRSSARTGERLRQAGGSDKGLGKGIGEGPGKGIEKKLGEGAPKWARNAPRRVRRAPQAQREAARRAAAAESLRSGLDC